MFKLKKILWITLILTIMMAFSAFADSCIFIQSDNDCSEPGDLVSDLTVTFRDGPNVMDGEGPYVVDVDVTYNVYSYNDPNNPYPIQGHNTFCQKITEVREGTGIKTFSILQSLGPENVGFIQEANEGEKEPINCGKLNIGFDTSDPIKRIVWDFRPDNMVYPGETSTAMFYTGSEATPIGYSMHEIYNHFANEEVEAGLGDMTGQPAPVPEFSTIGMIAAVIIIGVSFFFYRRRMQKKSQINSIFVIAGLLVIIIGILAFISLIDFEPTALVVKEVMDDGSIGEFEAGEIPAIGMTLETESGIIQGAVPLVNGKTFLIEGSS